MYKLEDLEFDQICWEMDYQSHNYLIYRNIVSRKWTVSKDKVGEHNLELETIQQAKFYLSSKYGVPVKGWEISGSYWRTSDKKWTLGKDNNSMGKWKVHLVGLGWQNPRFKTRSEALDWINLWPKKVVHKYSKNFTGR